MRVPKEVLNDIFALPIGKDMEKNTKLLAPLVVKYVERVSPAELGFVATLYGEHGKEKLLMSLDAIELENGPEKEAMMRHLFGRQN